MNATTKMLRHCKVSMQMVVLFVSNIFSNLLKQFYFYNHFSICLDSLNDNPKHGTDLSNYNGAVFGPLSMVPKNLFSVS